jgi:hypothetical protein
MIEWMDKMIAESGIGDAMLCNVINVLLLGRGRGERADEKVCVRIIDI